MRKLKIAFIVGMVFLALFTSITTSNTKTITSKAKQYLVSSSAIEAKSSMFVDASLEFGVPASILIAMAIEETGFGTAGVAISLNNWFGMEKSSLYPTDPNYTGRFEKYPNARASIRDAARLLGSPKSMYKVTNIIINNGGLEGAYDKIARSITAHWCVNEPGAPCSYDAQKLLDDIEKYDLTKYDVQLKELSISDIKAILDKYYGPNAIPIPGYDGIVQDDWNGDYTEPDVGTNIVDGIYFNTSYSGNIEEGYIYKKYAETPMWSNIGTDSIEQKVNTIIRRIFIQGEELYGDGILHADDFLFNGTEQDGPEEGGGMGGFSGMPLPSIRCYTSPFGYRGNIGVPNASTYHKGIDLPATMGTPIFTVADGRITFSGWYGSGGNTVIVEHANGVRTLYMHMSRKNVKVGDIVSAGDVIGFVGSTGASNGSHLHFQIEDHGKAIDPQKRFSYLANLKRC